MQKAISTKQTNKSDKSSEINDGSTEKARVFEIMFVFNDSEDSVKVVESPVIDFNEVIEHLRQNNAVFITPKSFKKSQTIKKQSGKHHNSVFITHV